MARLLRVGIDLTGIWRRSTGIFRYTLETTKQLLLLPDTDPKIQYVLFFSQQVHPDFVALQQFFETVICPMRNELFVKQLWFPAMLPLQQLDIMHYPTFPPPFIQLFGPRSVMNFYDTGPWRYAHTQTLHGRLYFRILLTRGMRTSTQVITLSAHARTEIGHFLGKHYLAKVSVAPGAVSKEFGIAVSVEERKAIRSSYQLKKSYFLTVATLEPRKNMPTLLDAYTKLHKQLGAACPELVVVGRKGWHCEDILRYMYELKDCVHFLGHIPDLDLIALYQMARCLVFPSLYEGFGLPILEAMTAGCPVITTNGSSLPEVAGNAALLVDPLDGQAITEALRKLAQDDLLTQRMSAAGHAQAKRYSWQQTAQLNREVYLKIDTKQALKS